MKTSELPILVSQYKTPNNTKPFDKKNPYRLDNAKVLVSFLNPDIEVLDIKDGNGHNRKRLIVLRCTCGKVYEREMSGLNRARTNLLCQQCANAEIGRKLVQKNLAKKMAVIEKIGYKLLSDVKDGIGQYDRLLLETKEGYRLQMTYISLTTKGKKDKNIFSLKHNKDNFIYNANVFCKINNLKTKVIGFSEKQPFSHPSIRCQCECGNYFDTSIYGLTIYGKTRCTQCTSKQSKWCKKVEDFLKEQNLSFESEVFLNGCKDIRLLPFDYKLNINNGLIEVDGEQHYCENGYSMGMNEEEKFEHFKMIQRHDRIKEDYCKENGIKFLRISYKEILNNSFKRKILAFVA